MTKNTPRLFIDEDFSQGFEARLTNGQTHYLVNVLRLKNADKVYVFNGREGEWEGEVLQKTRRDYVISLIKKLKEQEPRSDLLYAFAPLKGARLDYLGQKAVEMGVGILQPVITQHTIIRDPNLERIWLNAVEGAEQCGIMSLPDLMDPLSLPEFLEEMQKEKRTIIFADESKDASSPLKDLQSLKKAPLAVLIGPEGGFSDEERDLLKNTENTLAISLGGRILRADTAAVATLALVQATVGDWA